MPFIMKKQQKLSYQLYVYFGMVNVKSSNEDNYDSTFKN